MEKFTITGKDFIEAVNKTADIALQKKHNSILANTCVFVYDDRVDFTGMCYELFVVHTIPAKVEGAENQKYLINTKALQYIVNKTIDGDKIEVIIERSKKKFETECCGTISSSRNHKIIFKSSNYSLTTKLTPEVYTEYPDYRKVLPKEYDAVVEIPKRTLIDAIDKSTGVFGTMCLEAFTESIGIESLRHADSKGIYYTATVKTVTANATVKSDRNIRIFVKNESLKRALDLIDNNNIVMNINSDYIVVSSKDAQEKTIGIVETVVPLWD